jgi:hypothetical protein
VTNAMSVAAEPGTSTAFTLTRTGPLSDPLTVAFFVGGSAVSVSDYSPFGTNATFAAGAATVTLTITPVDDLFRENDETVVVQLLEGANYNLGTDFAAEVTIQDNDGNALPGVGFLSSRSTVRESDGSILIPAVISAAPDSTRSPVIMEYRIVGGSAQRGVDYMLTSTGYVVFVADGPMITNLMVNIEDDPNEVRPACDALHLRRLQPLGADDHGDRITEKRLRGEHINLLEGQRAHQCFLCSILCPPIEGLAPRPSKS